MDRYAEELNRLRGEITKSEDEAMDLWHGLKNLCGDIRPWRIPDEDVQYKVWRKCRICLVSVKSGDPSKIPHTKGCTYADALELLSIPVKRQPAPWEDDRS